MLITEHPLHGSGRADFPHMMFLRTSDAECGQVKDVAKARQATVRAQIAS